MSGPRASDVDNYNDDGMPLCNSCGFPNDIFDLSEKEAWCRGCWEDMPQNKGLNFEKDGVK